tara:strand:+ start:41 stop:520 length:480 start_codon:yes stop_codon:yes gene_type:complete
MITNDKLDRNVLLSELIDNQVKGIPVNKKLSYSDIKRITKYISKSIFDENNCCIWEGYITNSKPDKSYKGAYINFYFKKRKVALHRLLYSNFKESIDDTDYLKYTCENKGKCCNVNHMVKFIYNSAERNEIVKEHDNIKKVEEKKEENVDSDDFVLDFE